MYAWLETHPIAYSDSDILSLSWKGSVPLSEKEKQYIRKRSCVTGWIAVGTRKCVVGVTFSSIHTLKEYNYPLRTNFNLRGHNAEVVLVRWNEPFQKMATCDANGVIFVWIRFESRWSIELVNDRQHQVTDFAWSHDGRMALIAYKDGFVLVGSVQGQRYWSSQLNLQPHGSTITCGAWTPDDKTVLFGTNSGQVVAMDIHGAVLSQVGLSDRTKPIQYMCYNCEKFRMSYVTESIDGENRIASGGTSGNSTSVGGSGSSGRSGMGSSDCSRRSRGRNKNVMIAVQMGSREINFMRSYDDVVGSNVTDTHMTDLRMEWSSCGSLLAVAGWCCDDKSPKLKFYSLNGIVRFTLNIPSKRSISALTWAHNDKRMFVASGAGVFVVFVEKHLSSLQQLARNSIVDCLSHYEDNTLEDLHLPPHLKKFVACALQPTITPCFPKGMDLMKFVSTPPPVQKDPQTGEEKTTRYFCTMIVYEDERGPRSVSDKYGGPFVLYREYMGGLVPLLRGDKISKVRPEFVVYNPQDDKVIAEVTSNAAATTPTFDPNLYPPGHLNRQKSGQSLPSSPDPKKSLNELACEDDNESGGAGCEKEYMSPLSGTEADRDESGSSYSRRKKKKKRKGQFRTPVEKVSLRPADLPFPDKLPEKYPLIEVLANLWGTKFRLHGIHPNLPTDVGYVCYKTSVLHLQPRQMTIAIPLLDGSTRNVKSTSIGTVVFPGSGNALAGNNFPATCAPNFRPTKDNVCASNTGASSSCKDAPNELALASGSAASEQVATPNTNDVSMVPAAFFSCPAASSIGAQSVATGSHQAILSSDLCRFEQMHALRCRFLQQAQHSLSCDVKNMPPTDFASDEEMEQRVIKAAKSVKSRQPLEVAAAVASVLTNRSDDPVVSPVQRCPKHPPMTALVAGPGGSSTNSVPLATSTDLQLFAFPRFAAASPQLGAHSGSTSFPCRNYHHHLHQRMMHHRANIGNFGGSNGHVNNVSFLQRKVTCKPRPSLAVRPKSCFPGAGTASHGRSPGVASNMFLSLPPVPPPPLAPKPGVTPTSRPSAILSDDESAESGNENEKNISNVAGAAASGSKTGEVASSIKPNSKNCANIGLCKSSISSSLSPGVACSGDLLYSAVTLSALANQSNLCSTTSHAHSKSLMNNCSFQSCNFPLAAQYSNCEPCTPPQCKFFPYYRTRSCPPSQESLALEKLSAQFNPCSGAAASGAATSSNSSGAATSQPLSCRGEAAVRSKLGLMSLAPPSSAFGPSNSSEKRHSREASWSMTPSNANRKSSPIGNNRHSGGGVGQYNLCNNKAAAGDTSDSEAYLSGDEAAAAAITNPELRRRQMRKFRKLPRKPENLPKSSEKEEFVMLNKSPIWNESTQVYQLDFGGRVTQESAKNFQIEHNKEQVLQFGRIDENAYTLDFQTPFSALQAFGIALANVTQRLK